MTTSIRILFVSLSLLFLQSLFSFASAKKEREASDLPELTVESDRNKILHILAFLRDYSSLATYSDTVFLFREKLVDFMLVPNKKVNFHEWRRPRTLLSRSYYRFRNSSGRDSVSDESPLHFSWTDWMEMPPLQQLPHSISYRSLATDTLKGKYSPAIIWNKRGEKVEVDIDVLAASNGRGWCPSFAGFFKEGLDFERFRISFNFDNVLSADLSAADLTGYRYHIESHGRGHEMHRIPQNLGPVYISSVGEVYLLDREFLTKKEAGKWESRVIDDEAVGFFEPADAPPLSPEIEELIARVEHLDKGAVRLSIPPDQRLVSLNYGKRKKNIAERAFDLLKQLAGISLIQSRKNFNDRWDDFRKEQMKRNRKRTE